MRPAETHPAVATHSTNLTRSPPGLKPGVRRATYFPIEHVFGEMHGREAVRHWIVPLMQAYPNNQMVKYTHDWVYFDARTAEMVFCARTHMADLGDGMDYTTTNWTRLKYAGHGLFSLEEDIYNPANFVALIQRWEAATQQAKP